MKRNGHLRCELEAKVLRWESHAFALGRRVQCVLLLSGKRTRSHRLAGQFVQQDPFADWHPSMKKEAPWSGGIESLSKIRCCHFRDCFCLARRSGATPPWAPCPVWKQRSRAALSWRFPWRFQYAEPRLRARTATAGLCRRKSRRAAFPRPNAHAAAHRLRGHCRSACESSPGVLSKSMPNPGGVVSSRERHRRGFPAR